MAPLLNVQRTKSPEAGMLTITVNQSMHIKLCWKRSGDLTGLMHSLRDKMIVDPSDVYLEAEEFGFGDMLLLTPKGRITAEWQAAMLGVAE